MTSPQPTEAQMEAARVLNMRLHGATELGQRTQWLAEALATAHREGMMRAAEIARDEAERAKNSIINPVAANIIADRIMIDAGEA